MQTPIILCPCCQSDYVFSGKPGEYLCGNCRQTFPCAQPQRSQTDKELLSTKTDTPVRAFISHAHRQGRIVRLLCDSLVERGHSVWLNQKDIAQGGDFGRKPPTAF